MDENEPIAWRVLRDHDLRLSPARVMALRAGGTVTLSRDLAAPLVGSGILGAVDESALEPAQEPAQQED